ncbi:EboA domain-containing protein [Actinocorallia sp. A-T 12471]|uniref:EboA domain-containing protein n=1 Tax=Actinocorallia sp. A-T 12471 TaxID=3089813 RepID=UPI0029CC4D1A|nr:EboA domain-containing protein [Actinocorallia sp. A-T 12471]MDX6740600.1 EboA domain-containing protein [Actinocorallia sp. A-T 12471]
MNTTPTAVTSETLHASLAGVLSDEALTWIEDARATLGRAPERVTFYSAITALRCGRAPLGAALPGWTADDAVRVLLLCALRPGLADGPLADRVEEVYRQGDSAERRAVLRALPLLKLARHCQSLLRDALRTNDPRLIGAALGPCATALDQRAWRDGVLKCVFVGVPLTEVAGLRERMDADLLRMFGDYAAERRAAGRPVPDDLAAFLDLKED